MDHTYQIIPSQALELAAIGVDNAEKAMLRLPQAECAVIHRFGPGLYVRELHMPAGTLAIGHAQRYDHLNIVIRGKVEMVNADGSTTTVEGPTTFVGKAGRKVGYVVEDVVWQNVYATNLTDIDQLEAHFLDKSAHWGQERDAAFKMQYLSKQHDRDDFTFMLASYGFMAEVVRQQSEDLSDQTGMPMGSWSFKISDSPIEGKGVFMTASAEAGYVVGPARVQGKRTPLGRYTNHSASPNAAMVQRLNGDIDLVLTRHVFGCKGGENGEEVTIDYRQALRLQGITEGDFK